MVDRDQVPEDSVLLSILGLLFVLICVAVAWIITPVS